MSTDSLEVPTERIPAEVPPRCRETARKDAEVAEEDRLAEQPLTALPRSDLDTDLDPQTAETTASSDEHRQRVMSKKADRGAAEFTSSYGFFSKELWRERRAYLTIVVRPLFLITILIWTCLPVFWGALSSSPKYTPSLTAWFINRDGARIGNTIWESFSNKSAPGLHLGWVLVKPAAAGTNEQIMNAIVQQQAWVAVVVEANATTRLSNARANGDVNYDPTGAITMYYAQARLPPSRICTAYATGSAQRYFAQITPGNDVNATAVNLLSQAPQTISPGVAWKTVNLRPYTAPAAQAVTLVGNIFLIIFAFIMTMAHSAARTIIAPRLKFYHYLILRLVVPILAYLPLSLNYTLISLAFGLPFGGKYSPAGGFFMTFLFVYLGMTALGLSLEAMITLLTPRFIPFFVFTLIIFNVAPTLLPPELLNNFYSYGAGFPILNLSQAVRTIFFNTQNNLVQNAGVMIGWISLSCGTTLIFTWWMRRREIRALQIDESTSVPERLSRELAMQQPEAADQEKSVEITSSIP
ncbi:hypothetical protein BDY19DRAFT_990504 [Irpex rosettiformis]|uniref:Uncharacterized protein n=1 Tax=Irpex rosettiformis TaxID=378272 RepID=A0ACB8UEU3_9APHY|nr:hypothetical protein BDY19DRAFT_990504 [Irpex rosettiformis]